MTGDVVSETAEKSINTAGRYELTVGGKLLLAAAAIVAIGLAVYGLKEHVRLPVSGGAPATVSASAPSAVPATERAPGTESAVSKRDRPAEFDYAAELARERQTRVVLQAAWKAAFDSQDKRLSEMEKGLQELDQQVAAAGRPMPLKAKEEVSAGSHVLRKGADVAKVAKVDLSAMPIEFVTPEKSGISAFSKGGVTIGGERHAVGGKLPSGETLVAVDPESRTVVTDKRIVNVTN